MTDADLMLAAAIGGLLSEGPRLRVNAAAPADAMATAVVRVTDPALLVAYLEAHNAGPVPAVVQATLDNPFL
jgi:hypothetical protein